MTNTQHETLIAFSNAVEGKDDEFADWYWGTHLAEVLALPGFLSAKSYRLQGERNERSPHTFVTVYEIEGSAAEALNQLYTGGLSGSELLDVTTVTTAPFSPPHAAVAP
jgi:hypothetical protein